MKKILFITIPTLILAGFLLIKPINKALASGGTNIPTTPVATDWISAISISGNSTSSVSVDLAGHYSSYLNVGYDITDLDSSDSLAVTLTDGATSSTWSISPFFGVDGTSTTQASIGDEIPSIYNVNGLQISFANTATDTTKIIKVYLTVTTDRVFKPVNLSSSNVSQNSFDLIWDSVDHATEYEIFQDGVSIGTTTSTTLNVVGLTPSTAYSMEVVSTNGTSFATSSPLSVTTLAGSVLTAPIINATNLTPNSFVIHWNDVPGAISYEVFKDGTSYATTTATSSAITGLNASTTYTMLVVATDGTSFATSSPFMETTDPNPATPNTVVVSPSSLNNWTYSNLGAGNVTMETATSAPLGTGSLKLTTTSDNNDKAGIYSPALSVNLSDLISLSYETNQISASDITNGNATIRVAIDTDGDGALDDQLMYEPYYNGFNNSTGTMSGWQTWTITPTSGKFWSNYGLAYNGKDCHGVAGGYLCNFTINDVLHDFPNAKIIGVAVTMGTSNPSQTILADAVNLVTNTENTTYDFEPDAPVIVVPPVIVPSIGGGGGGIILTPIAAVNTPVISTEGQVLGVASSSNGEVLGATAYQFTRDMKIGSTGVEVKALQKFLNLKGYLLASSGAGSAGNETEYFGVLTKNAVIKYQEANPLILERVGITNGMGTGNFFWSTRGFVNDLLLNDSTTSAALSN